MSAAASHHDDTADRAVGALEAQHAIATIAGGASTALAWPRFVELATSRGGWKSTACRAFVAELSKHAARGAGGANAS